MVEETTEEKENSPQPSEEQNQGQAQEETPEQKPETPDYKTELAGMEQRIGDKIEKKISEVYFNLRKVSKGEPLEDEETPALNSDQIRIIVAEVVKEETGKIGLQLNQQVTELTKAFASKQSTSKGGGEGGQKLPKEEGTARPKDLSPDEEAAVEGCDWDSKRAGWIDRATKQFYPYKRHTTSPKEEE